MRILLVLVLLLAAVAGGAWLLAGRAEGPVIEITADEAVGPIGDLVIVIESPDASFTRIEAHLEQNGRVTELFRDRAMPGRLLRIPRWVETSAHAGTDPAERAEAAPRSPLGDAASEAKSARAASTGLVRIAPDRVEIARAIGQRAIPDLEAGRAEIVVTAVRPVFFGLRQAASIATREVEVRLTSPKLAVLSTHHYINHGGSEMVVYRVTPPDADSGVRVGELEYPGYAASGAGRAPNDPALRVAFFALLPEQAVETPIRLYARDALGNEATADFEHRVFPKRFRDSTIRLSDRFFAKVVPAILQNSPELDVPDPNNLLAAYLRINRELRELNNASIARLADRTAPEILWRGPFQQLMNSAVEAGFADHRTYVYQGRAVDEQVHLGFDLASTAKAEVRAANRGRVLHAGWLGIYGNCVILDHGMGLQSLYAHLSSVTVSVGDEVEFDGLLGRSGATGLAGGDHLHFTMLLAGHAITPIDWWSKKWLEDRVLRKLAEAGINPAR